MRLFRAQIGVSVRGGGFDTLRSSEVAGTCERRAENLLELCKLMAFRAKKRRRKDLWALTKVPASDYGVAHYRL
jgi:hypothetical protein